MILANVVILANLVNLVILAILVNLVILVNLMIRVKLVINCNFLGVPSKYYQRLINWQLFCGRVPPLVPTVQSVQS